MSSTFRRLSLHASALSDSEYQLYTTSLLSIVSVEDDGGVLQQSHNMDDAYYENMNINVRETRAWLRGRYSHLPSLIIDKILKLFSQSLSATDSLSGGEFFAVLRLIIHAENGKEVDRSLVFVQAQGGRLSNSDEGLHVVVKPPATVTASTSKRPRVDHVDFVNLWRTNRRRDKIPPVEELCGFLEQPLVESEKVPITELMYAALIAHLSPDKCGKNDISTLFKIGEVDPDVFHLYTAVARPSPIDGTEEAFHSFWDDNIRHILELLIPGGRTIRNGNRDTMTRNLRPDFGFLLQEICPFRGEEKGPDNPDDLNPRLELVDKLQWAYDPAPYILGYYCKASRMTLTAITAPTGPAEKKVGLYDIVTVNLGLRKDRITSILHLINLSTFLPLLSSVVRTSPHDFAKFNMTNSTVEITSTVVVKTYKGWNAAETIARLQGIYDVLSSRSIPNIDTLLFTKENAAYLSPRGIITHPVTEKGLRECLICILKALNVAHQVPLYHRDIRWPNIIRNMEDESKWFLIDWEDAAGPPTKAQWSFSKENHSPAIFHDDHGKEVDIWAIGHLITTSTAVDVSVSLRSLGEHICKESHNLSAEAVLALIS